MTDPLNPPTLEQAPEHIQLAVDLIYLLESNNISSPTALAALELVIEDLKAKDNEHKESLD